MTRVVTLALCLLLVVPMQAGAISDDSVGYEPPDQEWGYPWINGHASSSSGARAKTFALTPAWYASAEALNGPGTLGASLHLEASAQSSIRVPKAGSWVASQTALVVIGQQVTGQMTASSPQNLPGDFGNGSGFTGYTQYLNAIPTWAGIEQWSIMNTVWPGSAYQLRMRANGTDSNEGNPVASDDASTMHFIVFQFWRDPTNTYTTIRTIQRLNGRAWGRYSVRYESTVTSSAMEFEKIQVKTASNGGSSLGVGNANLMGSVTWPMGVVSGSNIGGSIDLTVDNYCASNYSTMTPAMRQWGDPDFEPYLPSQKNATSTAPVDEPGSDVPTTGAPAFRDAQKMMNSFGPWFAPLDLFNQFFKGV